MTLLSPLWLLGLLPWGAVVYWLLQRRRRPTGIPFIDLWRGPFHPPKPTRQFARPSFAVAMVLLAMLFAIVAASRPSVSDLSGRGAKAIPVVLDRGTSMSAGGGRFEAALDAFQYGLLDARIDSHRRIDLHAVPPSPTIVSTVSDLTNPHLRTAADTRSAVAATTSRLLSETSGPVVVVSDQPLGIANDRLIQVPPPDAPFRNVGIARLAARAMPRPQVMVTIGGRGWTEPVRAIVSSDGVDTVATIDAPSDGMTRDAFVDVPKLGQVVQVRLDVADDAAADNRAWLVRQGTLPKIEVRAAVEPAVQRVIESYGATRPAGEGSGRVLVVDNEADASNTPAVVVPSRRDGQSAGGAFTVSPHPATRDVDFSAIANATFVTDPPAGWTPVVRRGDDVWVAVRESPARQVWVGFDAPDWVRTPPFVVFWASLLDWVGGGRAEATYVATSVGELSADWKPQGSGAGAIDAQWWPGLFGREDGAIRGVNSGLVSPGGVSGGDWQQRLSAFREAGRVDLAPYVLLGALASALVAAIAWKRPSLTEISGKTTVTADGVLTEARAARAEAKVRLSRVNPDD